MLLSFLRLLLKFLLSFNILQLPLQLVLSFADEQGRAAGKVRMIVKLSNVAINEYDASHYDNDALGMDGVSVNGGKSLSICETSKYL